MPDLQIFLYCYKNTNIPQHQFHRWYKHLCLINHDYDICFLPSCYFYCHSNSVITTCKYTLYDSYEYYKNDESRLCNE